MMSSALDGHEPPPGAPGIPGPPPGMFLHCVKAVIAVSAITVARVPCAIRLRCLSIEADLRLPETLSGRPRLHHLGENRGVFGTAAKRHTIQGNSRGFKRNPSESVRDDERCAGFSLTDGLARPPRSRQLADGTVDGGTRRDQRRHELQRCRRSTSLAAIRGGCR